MNNLIRSTIVRSAATCVLALPAAACDSEPTDEAANLAHWSETRDERMA